MNRNSKLNNQGENNNPQPKSIKLCSIEALYKLKGRKFPVNNLNSGNNSGTNSSTITNGNDNTVNKKENISNKQINGTSSHGTKIDNFKGIQKDQNKPNDNQIDLLDEDEEETQENNLNNVHSKITNGRMSLKNISLVNNNKNGEENKDIIMLDENGDEMEDNMLEDKLPEKVDKLRTAENMKLRKHMTVKLHKTL